MTTSVISRSERLWRIILGFAACLEWMSYVLPYFFLPSVDDSDLVEAPRGIFAFLKRPKEVIVAKEEEGGWSLSLWLDERRYMLGVLFSVLWFVHSFVSANAARHSVLRRRDRETLLGESDGDDDDDDGEDEKKKKKKQKGDDDDKDKKDKAEDDITTSYDEAAYAVGGSWGVFAVKCLWYLLLLPVGFYMLSLLDYRDVFLGDGGHDDTASVAAVAASSSSGSSSKEDELALLGSDDVATFGNRVVTKQTRYCLAYATFIYTGQTVAAIMSAAVRTRTVAFAKASAKRLAKFAIRNPRSAKRRLRKALTALRWIKYLAPLIGTGNKLLGNTKDLLKKYRQSRRAAEAKRIRKELWTELTPEQRLERATITIQANYRARVVRKTQSALRLLQLRKRDAAVLRIQSILRRKANAARIRVMKKKSELRELRARQMHLHGRRSHMSTDERKRIYQLQDELGIEFQKSGTGMLLRPNTKFAVTWKVLFVVCVILEIGNLAVKPRLAKYKDGETGKSLSASLVLENKFVPDPVEMWEQCLEPSKTKKGGRKNKNTRKKKKKKKEEIVVESYANAADNDDDTRHYYYGPWYCNEPLRTTSRTLSIALRFLLRETALLVGFICFLDVFVTFFTGELDEDNGTLRPKPFFARWLLPGLVLQLLVNPMMTDVAAYVHRLRRGVHHVGPARVYRWMSAFVLPSFGTFVVWFEWNVWRRFVSEKNTEIVK
uniref:Uncharacterized protein n=1 Tax=Odontella aurita TaxID=265563 RepID=A0A6U6DX97_9STRA